METFNELNLKTEILKAVEEAGYKKPMRIQAEAIPVALEGKDIIGCATDRLGEIRYFRPDKNRTQDRDQHGKPDESQGDRHPALHERPYKKPEGHNIEHTGHPTDQYSHEAPGPVGIEE